MSHQFASRECIAVAFSILLLGACAQKDATRDTAATTATSTASTTTTSTTTTTATDTAATTSSTTGTATDTAQPAATSTAPPASLTTATPNAAPVQVPAITTTGATSPISAATAPTPIAAAPQTPAPSAPKLSLDQMPNDLPICNVAGNLIKVTDYKRMLRLQQMQMNATLATDPAAKARVLEMAKQNKIELTEAEKEKLYQAARSQRGGTEKEYQDFLTKAGATDADFRNEVNQTGLAFKTSNMILEQGLLPELVNRELLAQAALEAGGEKTAMNMYFRFKASKHYNTLKEQTQFTAEDIRSEIVKAELAKQQLARLEKKVTVTPADLKKVYDANKAALKHDEQIRVSKILLLCPPEDVGPMKSVKVQLANATKLTGEKLDAEVAKFTQQKRQGAMAILTQAVGGADFAKLANQYTEDPTAKALANGGDLGWLDVKVLVPELQTALKPLKKGEVLPQIVSNPQGFIIFKVTDKRPAGLMSMEDAKPVLEQKIKAEKLNAVVQGWLNKRKNVVRVEFTPNFLALAQARAATPPAAPIQR